MKIEKAPPRALFTLLTTPQDTDGNRWSGDFRLADIECMIVDYDLLKDIDISDLIPQK